MVGFVAYRVSMSSEPKKSIDQPAEERANKLGFIFASLLLRLWLGVRALQTGIEKYAGTVTTDQPVKVDGAVYDPNMTTTAGVKSYALDHYSGVPESLKGAFAHEPLMSAWALKVFDAMLGPALIVLGLTILLGIASRVSLLLLGLLYIGLTWGLILLKQDAGVAWLGVHMVMIAMALSWADYNRFRVLKKW